MSVLSVYVPCPDSEAARAIAAELLERHLIACANIGAPMLSLYRWDGAVQEDSEVPLLLKTDPACRNDLEAALLELHPYELPAILYSLDDANSGFVEWVRVETR